MLELNLNLYGDAHSSNYFEISMEGECGLCLPVSGLEMQKRERPASGAFSLERIAIPGLYFKRMSFLTDFTPFTPRATFMAVTIFSCERTKPLNWTTPLKVSTLISATFKLGSLRIAVFTLVVITVSSIYWPVLSCFAVEAQPTTVVNMRAAISVVTILRFFILIFPGW